ncbi:MAG: glycogen/starch/alpha-glucan family phosphorylase [Clostridia bacterium]|nr:glycogen/starch/alpha-glucan family phosphorylase [Clostridia bacterium]
MTVAERLKKHCPKPIYDCTYRELYAGISQMVNEMIAERKPEPCQKKLYYVSAEFLIGKLLVSNLLSLGIYDQVERLLTENGKSLNEVEGAEEEPSLGNGGLGRLAACFMDSVAALNLCGDGIGLCYRFGLFKQVFEENRQTEQPNPWMDTSSFLEKGRRSYEIPCGDTVLHSREYTISVVGEKRVNALHLFDLETVDETLVEEGILYDKAQIEKNLTLFLYPDDSDEAGKLLRLYQQYFMVANGARLILDECRERGGNLRRLYDYAVIQINDTHPVLMIPELIYLLVKEGIGIREATEIVKKTCAYTNHTILAEALECWPLAMMRKVVPHLVPMIQVLDEWTKKKYSNPKVAIIDADNRVQMANLAIHNTFSINGVAFLHTEILKHSELNHFYQIYPERFNNKTNGITFRRWLTQCNPDLDAFLCRTIGDRFRKDPSALEDLLAHAKDKKVLEELLIIKQANKRRLCEYLPWELNENSIFDIQIKRLHEYKRQQLNLLYLIDRYLSIKAGKLPSMPITAIFGAKAAPAYTIAKDIIHLILCMQELTENDSEVSPYLRVAMVENYNVTSASRLIPACEVSQQISLASKEASGTGNMKLMLNGAITLGTEDGANVEIHRLVGDDNIYIFGARAETVLKRYGEKSYVAREYYETVPELKRAVDFITGDKLCSVGNRQCLKRLQNELIEKDWFMTFPDFAAYKETRNAVYSDYQDRMEWAKKMLVNIAMAGYFSSDRTIMEYNTQLWKLK